MERDAERFNKKAATQISKKARAQKTAERGGAKLFTLIFYHILNSSFHQQFGTTLFPLKHGLTCKYTKQQQIANKLLSDFSAGSRNKPKL